MSYALWVRQIIDQLRDNPRPTWSLFDSSAPEPEALLRETMADGFGDTPSSRYISAFANGNPFAVAALARRYDVAEDWILSTTGATEALHVIYRALLRGGDRVLIETPRFELFDSLARSHGCEVDFFERRSPRFEIEIDVIKAALTPDTRMVVVSDLHNPSGHPLPRARLEELVALAEERDLYLVVDEVYGDYSPAELRPSVAAKLSPIVITVSSLTKIYGLSTVRCGWIIASGDTLAKLRDFNDRFAFGVSKLGHAVGAMVLENPAPFDAYTEQLLSAARPVIKRYFQLWRQEGLIEGVLPDYGCICFPRLVGIDDTRAFADWLMARSGVIVAPGELFGAPGHIRIGFAMEQAKLEQGLALLTDGLRTRRNERERKAI